MTDLLNYIDGEWLPATDNRWIGITDPSTGEALGRVPNSSIDDVQAAAGAAARAHERGEWYRAGIDERSRLVTQIANQLEKRVETLTPVVAQDTGCPVRVAGPAQIGAPIQGMKDLAQFASQQEWVTTYPDSTSPFFGRRQQIREPIGPVAALTPYNFPLMVASHKLAPLLLSGCPVVLKPSPLAPFAVNALVEACEAAGIPRGVVSLIHGDAAPAQALVSHDAINMVSFTGSTAVGRQIAVAAAPSFKRLQLELGGKSPALILEDADLELAAQSVVFGAMNHAGQTCVAPTRVIVPDSRYDEMVGRMAERMSQIVVGPALAPTSTVGPVISRAQQQKIYDACVALSDSGAKAEYEYELAPDLPEGGHYVAPVLFGDADNKSEATRNEIFGPIVAVIRAPSEQAAIKIANDSEYGLASLVIGGDLDRATAVGHQLDSGWVWVNDYGVADSTQSSCEGRKGSAMGPEHGLDGLFLSTRTKNLYTALDQDVSKRAYPLLSDAWAQV